VANSSKQTVFIGWKELRTRAYWPQDLSLPNCLIIGAAKSGTTSLWHYLRQHPDVFMHPRKQLNFFSVESADQTFNGPDPRDLSSRAIRTLTDYRAQFGQASGKTIIGEASNSYLYSSTAAARIRVTIPEVKLIAILRHPADRAYSRFLQLVRSGREVTTDFAKALEHEDQRIREKWWPDFHYLHVGLYYTQLKPYFDLFDKEQIRIYLFDDMERDALAVVKDAFNFLNVDSKFVPDTSIRYSASGIPRNNHLHRALLRLRQIRPVAKRVLADNLCKRIEKVASEINNKNLAKPALPPELRARMIANYKADTLRLQDLINRDLSAWLR
jgi:hypothetical protein